MRFFVDVRIADRNRAMPFLADHLAYLKKHFETGDFELFGAYTSGEGGLLIAKAENAQALEAVLDLDPLKKGDCATWEVREFRFGQVSPSVLTAEH